MFRKMRRFNQQITDDECIEVLKSEKRAVLCVLGDDGYPYGMPVNHYYDEQTGNIYFHGAKEGHRVDSIAKCDKVSLCVYDHGYRRDGEWSLNVKSVIVFGRIKPVTDNNRVCEICSQIAHKFTDDETYIAKEIAESTKNVLVLELVPEHITGKLVNES